MRVDDVFDRLVRNCFLDFLVHRERTRFAVGAFDGHDIIPELDGPTADSGGGEVKHAVGKLLHIHGGLRRRYSGLRDILRHGEGDSHIRLHLVDPDVEDRETGLRLHDVSRKLDPVEIRIIGIRDLISEVSDDVVCTEKTDFLDQVLSVERRLDVAVLDLERDDVALEDPAVRDGRLDHAMRGRPQLTQAITDRIGIWIGLRAAFSPGISAADNLNGSLIRADRLCGASARGVLTLRADSVHSHRRRLVVDRNVIAPLYETRPALAWNVCLPKAEQLSAAGIFDRVEIRGSHSIGYRRDIRPALRAPR